MSMYTNRIMVRSHQIKHDAGVNLANFPQLFQVEAATVLTMAMPCARSGCPGQASRRCEMPLGKQLCGNCCDCSGHGRRSLRAGPRSGGRAEARQEERAAVQREYRVLQEACAWLQACCNSDLQEMHLSTSTQVRKVLLKVAQATLLEMQNLATAGGCHRAWVIGADASIQSVRASDATHKCGHGHPFATNQPCTVAFIELSCIQQYCTAQAQPCPRPP